MCSWVEFRPRPALGMRHWRGHSWSPCHTSLCHCPVVRPAVAWLRGVWAMHVAGRVPPLDARVLLAGDHTVWDPGGGEAGAELWTHLRLLFCRAVWYYLRCCRVAHGKVFSASAVVALPGLLPGYDGLPGLTGFGCLLALQGRRCHCLLGASFKRVLTCRRRILSSAGALTMCWPRCLRMQTAQLLCVCMCHP